MIHETNGHVRRVVQKVRFVRTAKIDGNGHEIYGDWEQLAKPSLISYIYPSDGDIGY